MQTPRKAISVSFVSTGLNGPNGRKLGREMHTPEKCTPRLALRTSFRNSANPLQEELKSSQKP